MASGKILQVLNQSANQYCKMRDGTLLMWGNFSGTWAARTATSYTLTYPVAFNSTSPRSLICSLCGYHQHSAIMLYAWPLSISMASAEIRVTNEGDQSNAYFVWQAIGRWK